MEHMKTGAKWELFPHAADMGVRGSGRTKEEAFEQAALAMFQVIADTSRVLPQERVAVTCSAPDDELLLVDWLNALVYEMATRHMLFSRFEVHIEGTQLSGAAFGENIDVERHQPAVEIKGATYTALSVNQDAEGLWHAQCVVDV